MAKHEVKMPRVEINPDWLDEQLQLKVLWELAENERHRTLIAGLSATQGIATEIELHNLCFLEDKGFIQMGRHMLTHHICWDSCDLI